jgi:hypothetical protein
MDAAGIVGVRTETTLKAQVSFDSKRRRCVSRRMIVVCFEQDKQAPDCAYRTALLAGSICRSLIQNQVLYKGLHCQLNPLR